jgi:hypothetical protein
MRPFLLGLVEGELVDQEDGRALRHASPGLVIGQDRVRAEDARRRDVQAVREAEAAARAEDGGLLGYRDVDGLDPDARRVREELAVAAGESRVARAERGLEYLRPRDGRDGEDQLAPGGGLDEARDGRAARAAVLALDEVDEGRGVDQQDGAGAESLRGAAARSGRAQSPTSTRSRPARLQA